MREPTLKFNKKPLNLNESVSNTVISVKVTQI